MKSIGGILLSLGFIPCAAALTPQIMAMNCSNCHSFSTDGNDGSIPSLAGLTESQMLQQLLDFKYDRKPATLMPRIAKGYTDAELAALAKFMSAP